MARADRRVNEYLVDQVCENVESAPAPATGSSSSGARACGSAAQAPEAGASGEVAGQGGPAHVGAPRSVRRI
eukprot:11420435-Alexandrium_andersonii.AAC.1